MILNSRQKSIIKIITKFTPQKPGTILIISKELKLSQRTVLREMPPIEDWFLENSFTLVKKPRVGLFLDEKNVNEVLKLLNEEKVHRYFTIEERRRFIISELLYEIEPLKSLYFIAYLKISEGTLSSDLDYVQEFLKKYDVNLIRKQGVGIYIEAQEVSIRKAIVGLFYDFAKEEQIIKFLGNKNFDFDNKIRIFDFLNSKSVSCVKGILSNLEKELYVKYTDNAYILLIIYILVAVRRIEFSHNATIEKENYFKISLRPEYFLAKEISNYLEDALDITISQDETSYIAIHLMSVTIWIKDKTTSIVEYNTNIEQLVMELILSVEKEVGIKLKDNSTLFEDLVNHVKPALSRITMQIKIQNSQLEMLKTDYKIMYDATANACNLIKEVLNVSEIPESEIGFIAMHFCVASENTKSLDKKISVVIACPLGIGTSKMLAVKLKNEFKNIEICDAISVMEIDTQRLKRENIDLIISTVDLNVDFPNIKVSPLLKEKDKERLQSLVKGIKVRDVLEKEIIIPSNNSYLIKETIAYITNLGSEITKLLESIVLYRSNEINSVDDIYKKASSIYGIESIEKELIIKDLRSRENIASTYILDYKIYFMHCKTEAVKSCKFGYIKIMNNFINDDGNEVLGAIVMLMPKNSTAIHHEIISAISGSLIEYKDLRMLLEQNGLISQEIEKILGKLYKNTIKKKMEEEYES